MAEFSLESYSQLLSALKDQGYSFCGFQEINPLLLEKRPFVVLRHDIDINLRLAVEIARIEYEHDVRATYFVMLHSPLYNVLSGASAEILSQIYRYGHQIAAHIDLTVYDNDYTKMLMDVEVLSKYYPYINTELVSLHSPLDLQHVPIASIPQLNNVYGASIKGDVAYISDSTGRWRYGHPLDSDAFHARKPIQLLTHPIWWVQAGETVTEKLESWLEADYHHNSATLKEVLPKLFKRNEPAQ
jgi:hypothetical protein